MEIFNLMLITFIVFLHFSDLINNNPTNKFHINI